MPSLVGGKPEVCYLAAQLELGVVSGLAEIGKKRKLLGPFTISN